MLRAPVYRRKLLPSPVARDVLEAAACLLCSKVVLDGFDPSRVSVEELARSTGSAAGEIAGGALGLLDSGGD